MFTFGAPCKMRYGKRSMFHVDQKNENDKHKFVSLVFYDTSTQKWCIISSAFLSIFPFFNSYTENSDARSSLILRKEHRCKLLKFLFRKRRGEQQREREREGERASEIEKYKVLWRNIWIHFFSFIELFFMIRVSYLDFSLAA